MQLEAVVFKAAGGCCRPTLRVNHAEHRLDRNLVAYTRGAEDDRDLLFDLLWVVASPQVPVEQAETPARIGQFHGGSLSHHRSVREVLLLERWMEIGPRAEQVLKKVGWDLLALDQHRLQLPLAG